MPGIRLTYSVLIATQVWAISQGSSFWGLSLFTINFIILLWIVLEVRNYRIKKLAKGPDEDA